MSKLPVMDSTFLDDLRREQQAFDQQLPDLLRAHAGEFVVFTHGKPKMFFPSYAEAYAWALDSYGHDAPFLISEVVERTHAPISVSWNAGVLFGRQKA